MKYWSDCSSKCETPYKDNCRNRTATIGSCPANATCTYFSDCSSKISGWSCKSGYKVSGSSCVAVRPSCKIGDIFYTDNTCVAAANHNSNKTVLGIVVYVNPDGVGGQIMALRPIDKNGAENKTSTLKGMAWGPYGTDVSTLTNHTTAASAATDFDSCGNTDKIVAAGNASQYPAAWATRKYAPTAETKGKWCLPAAGVLMNVYNNRSTLSNILKTLGGYKSLILAGMGRASTEYNGTNVWYSNMDYQYGLQWNYKDNLYTAVWPVMEF